MYVSGDPITSVVDIGTETIKIGYSETYAPSIYSPTLENTSEFISPVQKSTIRDINSYLNILSKKIPVDTEHLVISENTMEEGLAKKEILKHVMENKLCNSVLFVKSGILDAFSYGKTTALVVSFGGGSTQVCSVVDGLITTRKQLNIGGLQLTETYKKLIDSSGIELSKMVKIDRNALWYEKKLSFEELELCRLLKEETADLEEIKDEGVSYEFPSGEILNLGRYTKTIPEALLSASQTIVDVIDQNQGMKMQLRANIIIAGGGSRIKGIDTALEAELEKIKGKSKGRITLEKTNFSTFRGGSIIGCIGGTKALSIGQADYEEFGDSILHRKNCDWLQENL